MDEHPVSLRVPPRSCHGAYGRLKTDLSKSEKSSYEKLNGVEVQHRELVCYKP